MMMTIKICWISQSLPPPLLQSLHPFLRHPPALYPHVCLAPPFHPLLPPLSYRWIQPHLPLLDPLVLLFRLPLNPHCHRPPFPHHHQPLLLLLLLPLLLRPPSLPLFLSSMLHSMRDWHALTQNSEKIHSCKQEKRRNSQKLSLPLCLPLLEILPFPPFLLCDDPSWMPSAIGSRERPRMLIWNKRND